MITIDPMKPHDALAIQRQASQLVQLGIERDMSVDEARALAEGNGEAWTVRQDGRIVACLGLKETFPGAQAVAWAILAERVGAAHLAITRHARRRIAASGLARIEAIVREAVPAGALDPDQIHLPGIFVHRIVVNASPEKRIEQRTTRSA